MNPRIGIAAVTLLSSLAAPLVASQEGVLPFASFSIRSEGIGNSGPVEIAGSYGANGLAMLVIKALGREFVLTSEQRQKLSGLSVNSIQLSYEGGYPQFGGRTIYIVLGMGFVRGSVDSRIVTLNERGDVSIDDSRSGRGRRTRG
jgi:hypothetical protein